MTHRRSKHDAPGEGRASALAASLTARQAALHPAASELIDPHLLTVGRPSLTLGSGDQRPPVLRPGSLDAGRLPSRMGDLLRLPPQRYIGHAPPAAQQPSSPAAQQPSSPAAQQPSSPAAQQPSSPAAQPCRTTRPTPDRKAGTQPWLKHDGWPFTSA